LEEEVQAHQVVLPPQLQDVYQEVEKEAQALDEVVEDQASLAQALVQACQDGRQVERLVAQEVQAHKVLLAPLHAQAQQELVEGSPQAQYRVVEAQAPLAQALEHEEQVLRKVSQILEENVQAHQVVLSPQLQDVQEPVEQEAQALDELVEDQASLALKVEHEEQSFQQVQRLVEAQVRALKVVLANTAPLEQDFVEEASQAQPGLVSQAPPLEDEVEYKEQVLAQEQVVLA
jgi:hypothetical protein